MAEQLVQCQPRRLQGLPLESPPTVEGQQGVTMEWPTLAEDHMETTPTIEPREEFLVYENPLVQLTPEANTSFHFPMEGRLGSSDWIGNHPLDETIGVEYGPNAPF